jgi:hypothetical protein
MMRSINRKYRVKDGCQVTLVLSEKNKKRPPMKDCICKDAYIIEQRTKTLVLPAGTLLEGMYELGDEVMVKFTDMDCVATSKKFVVDVTGKEPN